MIEVVDELEVVTPVRVRVGITGPISVTVSEGSSMVIPILIVRVTVNGARGCFLATDV